MSNILPDTCCKIRTENETNGNSAKFRLNSEVQHFSIEKRTKMVGATPCGCPFRGCPFYRV